MQPPFALLFLENEDSFSYLLADAFARLGVQVDFLSTYSHDAQLSNNPYAGVVVGPGPGTPHTSPHLMALLADVIQKEVPILGVCLGMQAIGVHFGATLKEALAPVHGKVRQLLPTKGSLLYPNGPEDVVRYHSLVLDNLPVSLQAEALSPDGELMALSHTTLPIWGVQYHPEAICTEKGLAFLHRWLQFAKIGHSELPLGHKQEHLPKLQAPILAL